LLCILCYILQVRFLPCCLMKPHCCPQ
jgi:hypothetical protein